MSRRPDKRRRPCFTCACGATAWMHLSGGPYVCIIDAEDAADIGWHNWRAAVSTSGNIYAERSGKGVFESVHRVVMGAPKGVEVDHRDGVGLNNMKANLRLATTQQNRANMRRRMSTNKSGYKGVHFNKNQQKYAVHVGYRYIGMFDDIDDAVAAYDRVAKETYGEFAATSSEMIR